MTEIGYFLLFMILVLWIGLRHGYREDDTDTRLHKGKRLDPRSFGKY